MIITPSNEMSFWLDRHLNKEASLDDTLDLPSIDDAISNPQLNKEFTEVFDQIVADSEERKRQTTTPFWAPGKIPRARSVGDAAKKRINNKIFTETKGLKTSIPLEEILKACESEGLIPLDDDYTRLSGVMLVGGGECGSEQAKSQRATFHMAIRLPDGSYVPATMSLNMSWCKVGNKYEVTAYFA